MSEIKEFKCLACGSPLVFDTTSQMLKCTNCDTTYDQSILEQYDEEMKNLSTEDNYSWQVNSDQEWSDTEQENLSIYVCQSCGGEIIADPTTISTHCPYCDNPVVLTGQVQGDLKPSYMIPFKLNREQAIDALKKHMEGKKLLPKMFKDQQRIEKIRGVYVPFWVFDADVGANMHYKANRIRKWSDSKYIYTEISHFSVFRKGNIAFEKIPVDASSKIDDVLMQSIEPFNIQEAVPFNVGYLSGFLADRYDETSDKCIDIANQRLEETTKESMRSTVMGYENVTSLESGIQISNSVANYVLYPVWFLNTKYEDRDYTFVMNGQTGRFIGDLPMDKKIAIKYYILMFLAFFITSYGAAWLIHLLL
ncbi:MAG: hypothetical protein GX909_01965 [Clostridiaceae bacterium]|nr:hypothetical protein [Clostridiaceae bacterium]